MQPGPLNDGELRQAAEEGMVDPFHLDLLQPASIDLRLFDTFLVPRDLHRGQRLDLRRDTPAEYFREVHPFKAFELYPGGFVLASTYETITLPADLQAQVTGKSSWARTGLAIEVAGYLDPGFSGRVTLELCNHGPFTLVLPPGCRICQLTVQRLVAPAERPYGSPGLGSHYQLQSGPTAAHGSRNEQ